MLNQMSTYLARRIGHTAAELVVGEHRATLRGNTSKGVYIQTDSRWNLFLSFGRPVGPLSVTLEQDAVALDDARPGSVVEIANGRLSFPGYGVTVQTDGAAVWRVPVVPAQPSPREDQLARSAALAREAVAAKQGLGLSGLLPHLMGSNAEGLSPSRATDAETSLGVLCVRDGLARGDVAHALSGVRRLVGRGRGLTPSGDDFLLGTLLALRRWDTDLLEMAKTRELRQEVVALAYEGTTGLSANLIECAGHGEADERLLAMVDSLYCGIPPVEASVNPMLTWGSSSGVDVLTGMIVTVLAGAGRERTEPTGTP